MTNKIHLTPIPNDTGFDGVFFSATLDGVRSVGTIPRSQLLRWADSPNEPEVHIFIRCGDLIEQVVLAKLAADPNADLTLSGYDF